MAKKKTSKAKQLQYDIYKTGQKWKVNRIARLEKHLKLHPEDEIAKAGLEAAKKATAPRRRSYKSKNSSGGSIDRFMDQMERICRKVAKVAQYSPKKSAERAKAEKLLKQK